MRVVLTAVLALLLPGCKGGRHAFNPFERAKRGTVCTRAAGSPTRGDNGGNPGLWREVAERTHLGQRFTAIAQ